MAIMVNNAFELATELGNVALKLNATGQGLSQLRELARQNGMSFNEMEEGLEEFATKIAEAVGGNEELVEVFAIYERIRRVLGQHIAYDVDDGNSLILDISL
ncbi:MAG: hypothetical protein ACAI35_06505 [Candidatus Methylacidiphilales bacterium]